MTNPKQKHEPGTLGAINASIDSISKRGRAFDTLIQNTGLEVLEWSHKHNDLDLVNRYVAAIPAGSKKQSLIVWLSLFGRLKPNEGTKEEIAIKPVVWRKDGVLDLDKAKAKLWHTCIAEKPAAAVFDIEKAFQTFMVRVLAAEKKGEVSNPIILAALKNVKGTSEIAADAAVGGITDTIPKAQVTESTTL